LLTLWHELNGSRLALPDEGFVSALVPPATQVTVVDTAGVPGSSSSSSSSAAGPDAADGFAADAEAAPQQREARAPSRRLTAAAGASRSQQAVKVSVVEADARQEAQ
jgi:hypothetical protein